MRKINQDITAVQKQATLFAKNILAIVKESDDEQDDVNLQKIFGEAKNYKFNNPRASEKEFLEENGYPLTTTFQE